MRIVKILATIWLLTLCSCSTISFTGENDIFGYAKNDDMMYSNGFKVTYTRHKNKTPQLLKTLADPIPSLTPLGPFNSNKYIFEFGQEMHTPNDIRNPDLLKDENPWVGYSYLKTGKEEITTEYKKQANFYLGVTGPWSFADKTQTWFHDTLGMAHPSGWQNQINNEVVFYHESGIELRDFLINYNDHKFEQSSGYNIRLGTFYTDLNLFVTHRYGKHYEMFSVSNTSDWSYQIYNTIFGRGIARDMTLDGNTFSDSHSVEKMPFVYGDEIGIVLEYKTYSFKIFNKLQSKVYQEQDKEFHVWGGFLFSKLFDIL